MYRPQFAYPKPQGNEFDQKCTYSFDQSNTPSFSGTIAAGALLQKIPLVIDQDADFIVRGIQIEDTTLQVGIEDVDSNPLVNPSAPGQPTLFPVPLWAATDGAGIVTLDSDTDGIFCQKGGALYAYVNNTGAVPVNGPVITLHGVKRFSGEVCP